jgi:hypothetical protein
MGNNFTDFEEQILPYIVYVGRLGRHRFVFKHLISGTPGKKRSLRKKTEIDDFYKVNI